MKPEITQCLLDMDGVIADFMSALTTSHKRPTPYTIKENLGIWETEKLWGITEDEFWAPIMADSLNFWSTIPKMPEADEIVEILEKAFGSENIAILTAASEDIGSVPGKRAWMMKHFPQFAKRMIFGHAKEFMAAPYRLLVDDRDKNVAKFAKAGGKTILIPRPWNSAHEYDNVLIPSLRSDLGALGLIIGDK